MITYFGARRAERVLSQYKTLVLEYWDAQPPDDRDWMTRDCARPENEASLRIREQVIHLFPEANTCANRLGVAVIAHSYPAPAVGGPVIPLNILYGAVDQDEGHARMPRRQILDTIDRCLATATLLREKLFWTQILNPVWWVTEVVAYVIRVPFLILRRAGLPATVEESVWGHVVKVLILIALIVASVHWGINVSARDLIHLLK